MQTADREAEPYHQGHIAKFKIGPASADLFRSLIPTMFAKGVEVDRRPPLAGDGGNLSAVIEPKLESFNFYSLRVGEWQFWADVAYRFDLYAPDGTVAASWTTKGEGETVGMSHGESGTWGKAVELAMEGAAKRFAASFETVPEAKRWLRDLAPGGAVAAADLQETRLFEEGEARGVVGAYAGIVRIRMELDPPEIRAITNKLPEGEMPRVMAIKLAAENVSGRPLAIRASQIHLITSEQKMIDPLPLTLAAAMLTQQQLRLGPVASGVGVAALPGLFVALANLAAAESEKSEYQQRMAALRDKEFEDVRLPAGAKEEGFAFFLAPPSRAALRGVEMIVPVIDIEQATSYVVRLPLGERPPTFEPYSVKPAGS